jgi:phosphate starvation-inducible PhoH-like protein
MSKPRKRNKNTQAENVVHIRDVTKTAPTSRRGKKSEVSIIPRNTAQENYVINLEDDDKKVVFAVGPAGTGKSYLCTLFAIRELKAGNIEKIILTRPAVGADGEKHGFLPGNIEAKMEPWLLPILDIFEEYYEPQEIKGMMDDGTIHIAPIAFMRGRSLKNAIILADEFQNTTETQAKCVLTRVGEGSRLFVTGDLNQSDFAKRNGLLDFCTRLEANASDMISVCKFERKHVERSAIVAEVLRVYGDDE